MSGQLILLDDDGIETDNFKPLNNLLRIGSDLKADVVLSGLKSLAFEITIDGFGRVSITNFMKKLKVNEKRMPKNVSRPLINNSMVQIQNYKFCWKYNPKLTKSYSMSPCSKPNQNVDNPFIGERRKTVCVNRNQFEDEGAIADKEPEAFIEDDNEENTTITTTVNKPTDDSVSSISRTPFRPIVKSQALSDPVMDDPKASDEYGTAMNIIDSESQSTSKRRTSLLLPVRENRATELRRASIRKSMSAIEHPISFKSFTPKKPNPSVAMVKGINAIVRVGLDCDDAISNKSPIKNRDVLDTINLQKLIKTPNKSFPQIIDKMDMFNVVTDEMKKVGPRAYVSSFRKLGAVNSPRRTPKKCFSTPKRQSLHSELAEMGICPIPVEEPISKDGEKDIPTSANQPSDEMEGKLKLSSDESDDDNDEPEPVECLSSSSDESVISVDDDSACKTLSSEDEANIADDTSENILVTGSTGRTESTPSSGPFIQTISDSERGSQISSDQVGGKEDTEDELDDSVFANGNETFVKLLADDTPLKLGIQRSEHFSDKLLFSTDSETAEMIKIPLNDDQPEHETLILGDKSAKNSEVNNDTEAVAVSTPLTRRPSLIRTRRNSRLCSLDECCNPNPLYGSPRKTKSEKKVQASPRSILKTPNLSKTPKKNVRILEPILHEEDDEETKTSAENVSQTPTALDETFEIDEDDSTIESSFVVAEMKLSHSHKTPEKQSILYDDQPNSSVLNKEIISTGVQDTNFHSNCGEDNGQKSLRQFNSSEPSNEMIDSEIKKHLRLNASIELEEATADIEHEVTKPHFSSVNDEGEEFVEPVNLPEPINKDIFSEVEQETQNQLKVSSDEIEGDTFETRLSSPEPNDQETCQDVIIPSENSEHREPQSDCNSSGTDLKEQFISTEPNKKIVSSSLNEISQSNNGEENRGKSVESTNSPKSNKIILSENEKESQLHASVGFEEPNSSETNEDIGSQINQSYFNSDKDKKGEFEESINSKEVLHFEITQELQLDESNLAELDEEESVNLPELSKEAILLEIKQQIFEQEQLTSSAPSDKEESLTETCQQIIIPSDVEPQSDSNTSVNGTDEEHPILTKPNKEIVSTDVKESHLQCIDGGENEKKPSDERSNQPEPSTEIILSEIKQEPSGASVELDEQLNLSEKNQDIENNGNKSCCSSGKDTETEFEEQIHSPDHSKEIHFSQQGPQSGVNSVEIEGETFEKRLTSPETNNKEEDINSTETCQQVIIPSETKGDGEPQSDYITSVNDTDEKHPNSTEPNKEIVSTDDKESHPNYNDGGKDEKKPSDDPSLSASVEIDEQLNLSEKNEDIENNGNKSCCSSGKDAETEFEEQIPSLDHSKEAPLSEIEQGPQLGLNSGGIEGATFEKRLTSPKPDYEEDLNSTETCQQIIIPSETKGDGESQLNCNTNVNGEEHPISTEPNKEIVSTDVKENHPDNDGGKDEKKPSDDRSYQPERSTEIILSEIKHDPPLGASVELAVQLNLSEKNEDIDNNGDKSCCSSGKDAETEFEEQIHSPDHSKEVNLSELKQGPQLGANSGKFERETFEKRLKPNDEEEDINSTETCQQIIIPLETKGDEEPQLDSNTSVNGEEETVSPEPKKLISTGVEESDSHSDSYEENAEKSVEQTNSSEPSKDISSLVIEDTHLHCNDGEKDGTGQLEERPLESSNEIIISEIEQKSQSNRRSLGLVDRPKSSELKKDIEHQNQSYSNIDKRGEEQFEKPINLRILSNGSVPSEKSQETQSKVDICEREESNEHNNSPMSSNGAHIPSLNEPTHTGQLKLDFEFKSRKTLLNKINSALGTYGFGSIQWSEKNSVDTSKDDTKPNAESRINETDGTALTIVPTQDVPEKLTSVTNDSETAIEIQSQCDSESASSNKETTMTEDLKQQKSMQIEPSESHANDIDESSKVPARRGRKIKSKIPEDLKSSKEEVLEPKTTSNDESVMVSKIPANDMLHPTRQGRTNKAKSDTTALKLGKAEKFASSTVTKTNVQIYSEQKSSESEEPDTDVPHMASEIPATSENYVCVPTRSRNNKAKSKTGEDSQNVEVVAVGKVKANMQGSRTRKTTAIKDSEAIQSDTDDDVNIPTRNRNNKAKSKAADDSEDLKLATVERESRTQAKKIVQRGRKRKITATKYSEANQSDTDDDENISTRGPNNNPKPTIDDDSKNVEVGAVGKVSRATVKANVHAGRTRKTTAIEDAEANQSDTDDVVKLAAIKRQSRTPAKKIVQRVSKRKITATKDSEANQSDTDDDVNISTRGPSNKAKPTIADNSKNVKVSAVGKVSRATVNKANVHASRTRKTTANEDSEANRSDTDNDVAIPTQRRNNKSKSKTDVESKNVEVGAVGKVSRATVNNANVQAGHTRKTTSIKDSGAIHSDTDDVVNIPTRDLNNKVKSNAAVEDLKVATVERAAAKKIVQKGRKKNITATEDSEPNQSDTYDVVNVPTRGHNKKTTFKKDSSAGAEKVIEKGGKRKITTIEASEAVHSDTDATSGVSAPNNNEKRITKRGRNNKAKADENSKTVEPGAIENVRKGRSRQATVAKNLEAPASTTDESQLVSETPATREDDRNIQERKGGKNKADASGASKSSKVDAVESVSEIATLKKATRGLKRKVNANDNTEATTLVEETHESRKPSKVRKLSTPFNDNDKPITKKSENSSETSSSTKVNQVNAPSSSQQSTTDGLKKINEKTKPESSNATSQPSKAVTRNRRKLAEVNSEADSESSKVSQLSKPVTRKRCKMTEVNSEIDVDEALQVPNEQTFKANTRPKRGIK